jgi:hypothetical protein
MKVKLSKQNPFEIVVNDVLLEPLGWLVHGGFAKSIGVSPLHACCRSKQELSGQMLKFKRREIE